MNFQHPASLPVALGPQISDARRLRGLSQRKLALIAGIDFKTGSALEADGGTMGPLIRVLGALQYTLEGCTDPNELGVWLRELRRKRGLSQRQAVTQSGLSRPTIIALERGEGHLDSLRKLLAIYGLPLRLVPCSSDALKPKPTFTVIQGDAAEVLTSYDNNYFDACVSDPPYGLGFYPPELVHDIIRTWVNGGEFDFKGHRSFMGQEWDGGVPQPRVWSEILRVLKPGAHLVAFASPRTVHLTMLSLNLAGAEIRDSVAWISKGGFARGQDAGRMLAKRVARQSAAPGPIPLGVTAGRGRYPGAGSRARSVPGTALTSEELLEIAPNAAAVLEQFSGTGGTLKPAHQVIILARKPFRGSLLDNLLAHGTGGLHVRAGRYEVLDGSTRYPANVVADLPPDIQRYFYAPKVRAGEKDRYLPKGMTNAHPCVKPVALMEWLVELTTKPGARVLDPFAGSGSTGCACVTKGRHFVGIEREAEYVELARARVAGWSGGHCS